MKLSGLYKDLSLVIFSYTTCFASSDALLKKRALDDLETIRHIFEVKYAPLEWKYEWAAWNLHEAIEEAKNKIAEHPKLSMKECQIIIRDFFNSVRDYHVGVRFYSTESASLPFLVKGAQKRYFICETYKDEMSTVTFPFKAGDEILTFDGRPIHEVVEELRVREYGSNTYETDLALAEMTLTYRQGSWGHRIPKGPVEITVRKMGEEETVSATLQWDYVPEKIRDFTKIGLNLDMRSSSAVQSTLKTSPFFQKFMVFYQWDCLPLDKRQEMSRHLLGSRSSYLPPLGKRLWKSTTFSNFDAYIFQSPKGKKIGYIRIPHFSAEVEELEEFGEIMNIFQKRTDALVIDQLNNPGGSAFYLYAIVSTFANKPFYAPKHHLALTQEEVQTALYILSYLDQIDDEWSARTVLGEEMGGYPVTYEFALVLKKFCLFIIDQWNAGKIYSDPIHLFGVDHINPHPHYRYKKPVLLLVNSLDFSCGDFFPAIMQDNKRAVIMGTRTAGAGGYVMHTEFPNQIGMKAFVMTGSLAERINRQPIENLGVKPDVFYELTPEDMQNNYRPFAHAIVEKVESLSREI